MPADPVLRANDSHVTLCHCLSGHVALVPLLLAIRDRNTMSRQTEDTRSQPTVATCAEQRGS